MKCCFLERDSFIKFSLKMIPNVKRICTMNLIGHNLVREYLQLTKTFRIVGTRSGLREDLGNGSSGFSKLVNFVRSKKMGARGSLTSDVANNPLCLQNSLSKQPPHPYAGLGGPSVQA